MAGLFKAGQCFATLSNLDMQLCPKIFCNFVQKGLAKNKTGEHENIFPSTIEDLDVSNFQMVYYNPWDPQYIAWLEVTYDEQAYQRELKRLKQYGIEEYIGEYGATGFSEYDVQAMDVLDQHYGMVYALRDDEKQSITYVELFFCNFFYDLEYWKYIDESLLPEHFDAKMDNVYRETYLEELSN